MTSKTTSAAEDPVGESGRAYARGVLLVLVAGALWSTAGIVIRHIDDATGWQIQFYRSAALVPTLLVVIMLRNRGAIAPVIKRAGWNAVVGGIGLGISSMSFTFAILNTTVANVLFVLAAGPVLAGLLGWVVLSERISRYTLWAMILAVAGVMLMTLDALGGGRVFGNLMALISVAGYAVFTVALRRGRHTDMLPAALLGGLFATIVSGIMAGDLVISGHDLLLCLFLGAFQLGLGLALYTFGSVYVPAAELSLLAMTEVVLGPIWVWLGVGEVPTLGILLGGAIVLAAIFLRAATGIRRTRPPIGVA